jgi:hypothetical protein
MAKKTGQQPNIAQTTLPTEVDGQNKEGSMKIALPTSKVYGKVTENT